MKIPSFIKFPIAVFCALTGVALAFLPIEERPLDRWIINFIKSVYAPTRYLWQKRNPLPEFLQPMVNRPTIAKTSVNKQTNRVLLQQYIKTHPLTQTSSPLDQLENQRLSSINLLISGSKIPILIIKPTITKPATLKTNQPIAPVITVAPKIATLSVAPPQIIKYAQPSRFPVNSQRPTVEKAKPLAPPLRVESLFPVAQRIRPEASALFVSRLSIPMTPEAPNLIAGTVVTTTDKILPNALIEIQTSHGNTVRALKTNKLGQFFTASPLDDGLYKIKAEHDNYQFDIMNIRVEGLIIPPIKLKAIKEISSPVS